MAEVEVNYNSDPVLSQLNSHKTMVDSLTSVRTACKVLHIVVLRGQSLYHAEHTPAAGLDWRSGGVPP